ncbi:hypothetical protein D3C87_1868360 [compost metagenome]
MPGILFANGDTSVATQQGTNVYTCIKYRETSVPAGIISFIQLSYHGRNVGFEKASSHNSEAYSQKKELMRVIG